MDILSTLQSFVASPDPHATPDLDSDTAATAKALYQEYLHQTAQQSDWWNIKPNDCEAGRAIFKSEPTVQIGVVFAGLAALTVNDFPAIRRPLNQMLFRCATESLLSRILRHRLPFTEVMLCGLIRRVSRRSEIKIHQGTARSVAQYVQDHELTSDLQSAIEDWRDSIEFQSQEWRKLGVTLDEILGVASASFLLTGEPWGAAVDADLRTMPSERSVAWEALLAHCASGDAAKPSQKWLTTAKAHVAVIGAEAFQDRVRAWFRVFARTVPSLLAEIQGRPDYRELSRVGYLVQQNGVTLRGLAWCCRFFGGAMVPDLGDLAIAAYKKIPLHGPSSSKAGNACIQTLGALDDPAAVTQISRLCLKIPYQVAQSLIGKTLMESAARLGVSQDDLEEMALPTYGLDEQGRVRQGLGSATAEIAVCGMQATLHWLDGAGKPLKSIPASVKREHAGQIKALQATRTEIEKTLLAQRARLEGFYLNARDWNFADWRERFIEHPLMHHIARRLIWQVQTQDGIVLGLWRAGSPEDVQGKLLTVSGAATVSLWHPLESSPETVLAWRLRLESLNLVQPFKQAHREVYLLTDAERATGTYSNRFAAHIVKQHQFHALCRQRGWKYDYQGRWDSHNVPARDLPLHGMAVEFLVEPAQEELISEAGVYLYLATDQVRFTRPDRRALPLPEIPPLLFSELMRDVDLFVGVASVGNDPAWRDGGEQAWGRAYWQDFAFGDLSATAQTRRSVLERLLPRLKIAGRCTLDGKFLIVRGDIRTYKIHLGSGNILMEPNDQYLCIVPGRSEAETAGETLFLPFEGDRMLSIILSKTFLLADDASIKDPTIIRQIGR